MLSTIAIAIFLLVVIGLTCARMHGGLLRTFNHDLGDIDGFGRVVWYAVAALLVLVDVVAIILACNAFARTVMLA